MAKLRVGVNGFGRIGRILFRAISEKYQDGNIEIVGVNNLGPIETMAHLLKYDSTQGKFKGEIKTDGSDLVVDGRKIKVSSERDPAQIPWRASEVDVVMDCTGAFKSKSDFVKHIASGAKKIMVSAPAEGADLTVVYGINHEKYDPSQHDVISNASCTTNCLAPLAKSLNDEFGIERGMMTTVHSYTNDQRILDTNHKDLRRARAAAVSMIPTTTGAAVAVGKVLPELNGKIDGLAIRVPTPNVSLVDLVFESNKAMTIDQINDCIKSYSNGPLKGILSFTGEPLVSVDFMGNTYSSVVDLSTTMIMGPKMAKVLSWYDNEMGFSNRMVDLAEHMLDKGL